MATVDITEDLQPLLAEQSSIRETARVLAEKQVALQAELDATKLALERIKVPTLAKVSSRAYAYMTSEKAYDNPDVQKSIARFDAATVGFYVDWKGKTYDLERQSLQAIKAINPWIRIAQYTVAMECPSNPDDTANDDLIEKLNAEKWWALNVAGLKTRWTEEYKADNINILNAGWMPWFVQRCLDRFFTPIPEIDIWFWDNVFSQPRGPSANWLNDGIDRSGGDPLVSSQWQAAYKRAWSEARTLAPRLTHMGNADNDLSAYRGQLDHVFNEFLLGKSWSVGTRDWGLMMNRYRSTKANIKPGGICIFGAGGTDPNTFRFALASCLMDDGHLSFTDTTAVYKGLPWFPEYDLPMGSPIDTPQFQAWSGQVYRRRYEGITALVNPSAETQTVSFERHRTMSGTPVTSVTLAPREGIVLVRS